jgi:hypothetical protein
MKKMEIKHEVFGGKFDAEGKMIEGATIILHFIGLEIEEYRKVTDTIIRTFGAAPTDTRLRKNRKVVVTSSEGIHDGGMPSMGRVCDV